MKILVIGGSGFIGTHLIRELNQQGHEVKIFDINPSPAFPEQIRIGDVRDIQALLESMQGIDIVYNLAAEHRDDVTPVSLYYDVNIKGVENIVEAAEKNKVKNIIFTSTVAVYALNQPEPDEQSPTEPFNRYGKSKLQAEMVFKKWADRKGERSLVIVRPSVIFGENNRGNVYNLIQQLASNKFIMVGAGDNIKSIGYVGNLVHFLVKAIELGEGIHLFNYADKPDLSVKKLVYLIRNELGKGNKIFLKLPYQLGLIGGYAFDALSFFTKKKYPISSIRIKKFCANTQISTQALDRIDFKAPYKIEEGLKRMIASL